MFSTEVVSLTVPTERFVRLEELGRGDLVPETERTTPVMVAITVYRNVINWFVIGEMNKDAQSFRNEIYFCAAMAHREVEHGCDSYYRGTNSYHSKVLHSDTFESMYNHNHYPIGRPRTLDEVEDISPEKFRAHLLAFSSADAASHAGTPRFLPLTEARAIADAYELEFYKTHDYDDALGRFVPNEELQRHYTARTLTEEDHEEHAYAETRHGACIDREREIGRSLAGLDSHRADERQAGDLLPYVEEFRRQGRERAEQLEQEIAAITAQTGRASAAASVATATESASAAASADTTSGATTGTVLRPLTFLRDVLATDTADEALGPDGDAVVADPLLLPASKAAESTDIAHADVARPRFGITS